MLFLTILVDNCSKNGYDVRQVGKGPSLFFFRRLESKNGHDPMQNTVAEVKALTFDVFGTVVDWYSSIVAEGEKFGETHGIEIDWTQFALKWRAGYGPAMNKVRHGELPWQNIDALHRLILDDLLAEFNFIDMSEAEKDDLNRVWHRLQPWPDVVSGLTRLRKRYIVATLSNGNVAVTNEHGKICRITVGLYPFCRINKAL